MHTSAATPPHFFMIIFPGVPENFVHHMQVHRNQGKFCIFYLMPPHYICVFTFSAKLKMLRKICIVMYFQKNEKLKLPKDIVICDPQAVFTSISELNIYDPTKRKVEAPVFDRFTQKGFFSPEDHSIEATATQKNHVPIEDLVPLLEYLNIAVPMVVDSISGYFLPAVLRTATNEVLNEPLDGADPGQDPEPLCICFKTGFVPLGFVSALYSC